MSSTPLEEAQTALRDTEALVERTRKAVIEANTLYVAACSKRTEALYLVIAEQAKGKRSHRKKEVTE